MPAKQQPPPPRTDLLFRPITLSIFVSFSDRLCGMAFEIEGQRGQISPHKSACGKQSRQNSFWQFLENGDFGKFAGPDGPNLPQGRLCGHSGITSGLPVNRPELQPPEISRAAVFAECVGNFSPTDTAYAQESGCSPFVSSHPGVRNFRRGRVLSRTIIFAPV